MKKWIIVGLAVALIAVSVGAGVIAQSSRTANVEVRVWEDVNDPERNFISARPEGGSWRTLGTIPLPLTDGMSSSGRFRYGDITLAVPLPAAATPEGGADHEEYAKVVCSVDSIEGADEFDDSSTMQELKEYLDQVLEDLDVDVPVKYSRWHAARVGSYRILRDWFDDQDDDKTLSGDLYWELLGVFLVIRGSFDPIQEQLSDEDAQVLIDAGCDIERGG